MFNELLFEKTKKLCGSFFCGPVEESIIRKFEKMLGVTFPDSYVEFIKRYGEGGICGTYINGVSGEEYSSVMVDTEEYRKKGILPQEHIVIAHSGRRGIEELSCLDTSRMVDGECPVVQYKFTWDDGELLSLSDYAIDFWDFFNKQNETIYVEKGIPREQEEACDNKGLPLGMGFGCCWMVVEETSQKAIVETFLQGKTAKYEYKEGLDKIAQADFSENLLAITATYKKQNYIIGPTVSRFFYETETFLEMCKELPRVYIFMTDHVSETHGFALVENGKIVRLFSYDEENIRNIGEPLPEEIALSYRLPKSFDDVWNTEENFTNINEDMLVELAIRQVGVDVEQYPYKKVTVGKMK